MIINKQTINADDLLVNDLNGSESFMGKVVYLMDRDRDNAEQEAYRQWTKYQGVGMQLRRTQE